MRTTIFIENLKCGGCEATVRKHLKAIPGILKVDISHENNSVDIEYNGNTALEKARQELSVIGYPETGSVTGLKKAALNAKSYLSCAVGRVTKKEKH